MRCIKLHSMFSPVFVASNQRFELLTADVEYFERYKRLLRQFKIYRRLGIEGIGVVLFYLELCHNAAFHTRDVGRLWII